MNPNQFVFNTMLKNKTVRMPNADPEILPSIGSLCKRIPNSHNLYDINQNSKALDKLDNLAEKRKLEQLRQDIKEKFKGNNQADKPF